VAISINQFKTGLTVLLDNDVYQIIELQHVKPGKGAAFVRTKLRNLKNSAIIERTFRGDDRIEEAFVEEKTLQYLYHRDKIYLFMDHDTYEEIEISLDLLEDKVKFLKDSLEITAFTHKGQVLNINLPNFVEFKVIYTETGMKGDTVKSGSKPAKLETEAVIQVPIFIESGYTIKVDTRTGEYIERINA
jgi:elongation factor P